MFHVKHGGFYSNFSKKSNKVVNLMIFYTFLWKTHFTKLFFLTYTPNLLYNFVSAIILFLELGQNREIAALTKSIMCTIFLLY